MDSFALCKSPWSIGSCEDLPLLWCQYLYKRSIRKGSHRCNRQYNNLNSQLANANRHQECANVLVPKEDRKIQGSRPAKSPRRETEEKPSRMQSDPFVPKLPLGEVRNSEISMKNPSPRSLASPRRSLSPKSASKLESPRRLPPVDKEAEIRLDSFDSTITRKFGQQFQEYMSELDSVVQDNKHIKRVLESQNQDFNNQMKLLKEENDKQMEAVASKYEKEIHKLVKAQSEEKQSFLKETEERQEKSRKEVHILKEKLYKMELYNKEQQDYFLKEKEKNDLDRAKEVNYFKEELLKYQQENKRMFDLLHQKSPRRLNSKPMSLQELLGRELEELDMKELKETEGQLHNMLVQLGDAKVIQSNLSDPPSSCT